MGQKIMTFGEIALGLILVYILVSNWRGTTNIGSMILKGTPPVIASLQGVGPGYPPPAR